METNIRIKLMSLPKKVRAMTLAEFIAAHLQPAATSKAANTEAGSEKSDEVTATPGTRRGRNAEGAMSSSRPTRSALKRGAAEVEVPDTATRTTRAKAQASFMAYIDARMCKQLHALHTHKYIHAYTDAYMCTHRRMHACFHTDGGHSGTDGGAASTDAVAHTIPQRFARSGFDRPLR